MQGATTVTRPIPAAVQAVVACVTRAVDDGARVPFGRFSLTTLVGSGTWCSVLAWFGAKVLENEPRLLEDPEALTRVLHEKLIWLVVGAATMLALYVLVDVVGRRLRARAPTT